MVDNSYYDNDIICCNFFKKYIKMNEEK